MAPTPHSSTVPPKSRHTTPLQSSPLPVPLPIKLSFPLFPSPLGSPLVPLSLGLTFRAHEFSCGLTFGAHECGLHRFAPVSAALVEGQTLLPGPRHHLRVLRQQTPAGQGAHAVDPPRVGVRDKERTGHRVHGQEVLMGGVVTEGERDGDNEFLGSINNTHVVAVAVIQITTQ